MPRKPRPTDAKPPRFFPAGEDADLLDEDDDAPTPIIEFGRRASTPQEETRGKAKAPRPRRKRST